jgi:hypothetical protein
VSASTHDLTSRDAGWALVEAMPGRGSGGA